MNGNGGNDTMHGDNGNDAMRGGSGDDTMYGNDGRDNLLADSGNDTLSGGAGNDKLTGGTGDDLLIGGAGADAFLFASGDGTDTIQDFEVGVDTMTIDGVDLATWMGDDTNWTGFAVSYDQLTITSATGDAYIFEDIDVFGFLDLYLI